MSDLDGVVIGSFCFVAFLLLMVYECQRLF